MLFTRTHSFNSISISYFNISRLNSLTEFELHIYKLFFSGYCLFWNTIITDISCIFSTMPRIISSAFLFMAYITSKPFSLCWISIRILLMFQFCLTSYALIYFLSLFFGSTIFTKIIRMITTVPRRRSKSWILCTNLTSKANLLWRRFIGIFF